MLNVTLTTVPKTRLQTRRHTVQFGTVTLPEKWRESLTQMRTISQRMQSPYYAYVTPKVRVNGSLTAIFYTPQQPHDERYSLVQHTLLGPVPGLVDHRFNDAFELVNIYRYPNPHGDPNGNGALPKGSAWRPFEAELEGLFKQSQLGPVRPLPKV